MDLDDYIAALASEGGLFANAITAAAPDDPIPTCPSWAMRDLVLQCMEVKEEGLIQSPCITLSVTRLKPSALVTDESAIPSRFYTPQPPKLDKAALKEAVLTDGEVIDGVTIGNGKTTLTIRRK